MRDGRHAGDVVVRAVLGATLCGLAAVFACRTGVLVRSVAMVFGAAVCATCILTPATIALAQRFKLLDYPGPGKIHAKPTPRLGGIPLAAATAAGLLLTCTQYLPSIRAMLAGSALVLLVGIIDDLAGLSALIKLFCQILACLLLIADGVHVTFLPDTSLGLAGEWLITVVWLVGIANAMNFLDGMDGLVSGLAAMTGLLFGALSALAFSVRLAASPMLLYCSAALAGSAISFLGWNVGPARIFLGDGGSTFLGFFLGAMSVHGSWSRGEPIVSFFIPILLLSVPIYDMIFTTAARMVSGRVTSFREWFEIRALDHIHHRLAALGLTQRGVVATIWCLNTGTGLGAVVLFEARFYQGAALVAQVVFIYAVIAIVEMKAHGIKSKQSTLPEETKIPNP